MRPLAFLLFCLTALLPAAVRAEQVTAAAIDAVLGEALKAWNVPGAALAVVRGDEVVHLKGYGVREASKAEPVTADTVFAIASLTKAFTATAAAMLVDEGKMTWDDPVRKHLPTFRLADPLADEYVTIRDLFCHRTGLSRHDLLALGSPWGRDEVLRRIALVKPTKPFRSTYQYNNIMYLAAGQAVGAAAGTTWDDFMRQRLFEPLGMKSASMSITALEHLKDRATPHRLGKDGKLEPLPWRNLDNTGPAGSINASIRDLARWVRFQLGDGTFEGKRLVSAKELAETRTPQMIIRLEGSEKELTPGATQKSYGLGWGIYDYRNRLLASHTGGLQGFRSRIVLVPAERLGIAILTNSGAGASGAAMHVAATTTLLDLFLASPKDNAKQDWNRYFREQMQRLERESKALLAERDRKRHRGTKPSRELDAYSGTYTEPAYGTATVSVENGGLQITWGSHRGRLEHFHYDTFTAQGENPLDDEQAVFRLGTDGEVAAVQFLGVEFRKHKEDRTR